MPLYEVELEDGRIVELEADTEPTDADVSAALDEYQAPSADLGKRQDEGFALPGIDQKKFQAEMESAKQRRAVGGMYDPGTEFTAGVGRGLGFTGQREIDPREDAQLRLAGLPPEQRALAEEKLAIEEEGVPIAYRMAAAGHSGLAKGMQLPTTLLQTGQKIGRQLPGSRIVDTIAEAVLPENILQMRKEAAAANDEYFGRLAKWEKWMSDRDAMLGAPSFATDLSEATFRGFAELPVQMLGGAAGSVSGQAMRGAAIGAGATSGAQQFSQELGAGATMPSALTRGATAGLITALTTRAFGETGVEAIFRNSGPKGVAARLVEALRQAGYEGAEEAFDQIQQDLADRVSRNPNRPISQTLRDVLLSGAVGVILGGGMGAVASGGRKDAGQVSKTAEVYGDVRQQPGEATQQAVPTQEGGTQVQQEAKGRLPVEIPVRTTPSGEVVADQEVDPEEAEYLGMEAEGLGQKPLTQQENARRQELFNKFVANEPMSGDEMSELDDLDVRWKLETTARYDVNAPPAGVITETENLLNRSVRDLGVESSVDVVPPQKLNPNNPLYWNLAQYNPSNKRIEVNGRALAQHLATLPAERRAAAVDSLIFEELVHSQTPRSDATKFASLASGVERALGRRIYSGKWSGKLPSGRKLNDTMLGYEIMRRRIQRLSRMQPTEIALTVGRERWTLQTLDAMDRAIAKTREVLGTKASAEQLALLDKVQGNIKFARSVAESGAGGGAGDREMVASPRRQLSAAEVTQLPRGDESFGPDELESMSTDEVVKLFTARDEKGPTYSPQYGSVIWGSKQDKSVIPDLEKARDAARDKMVAAFSKNDLAAFQAEQGKMLWYSGALEGARREGGNYTGTLERMFKVKFDGKVGNRLQFTILEAGPAQQAQFTVPEGANPDQIEQKKQQTIQRFEGDEPIASPRRDLEARSDWYDSGVLTKDGSPITVYHGSPSDSIEQGAIKTPAYFSPSKSTAKTYMGIKEIPGDLYTRLERSGKLYKAHIKFTKPLTMDLPHGIPVEEAKRIFDTTDYDAIINLQNSEYVVRNPDQVNIAEFEDESGLPIAARRRGLSKTEERLMEQMRRLREAQIAKAEGKAQSAAEAMAERLASAHEPPTPNQLTGYAQEELQSALPSFESFLGRVRMRHGPIPTGDLMQAWSDSVWSALENASSEQLTTLVDKLGLRRQVFGTTKTAGVTMPRTGFIAEPGAQLPQKTSLEQAEKYAERLRKRAEEYDVKAIKASTTALSDAMKRQAAAFRLAADRVEEAGAAGTFETPVQQGLFPGTMSPQATYTEGTKGKGAQRPEIERPAGELARKRAIAVIGNYLMNQGPSVEASLNRKELGVDDVRWTEQGDDIMRVATEDLDDLDTLGRELTVGAGTNATTKRVTGGGKIVTSVQALPRSATRRVVALLDRATKKVYLVSAYRDGYRGPLFRDPLSVTGEHRSLKQLTRFRPIWSIPLDLPVQNFVQEFKSLKDFSDRFMGNIQRVANRVGYRGYGAEFSVEGTEALEGEGGYVLGPSAILARAVTDTVEGARDIGAELTNKEAKALYRVFSSIENYSEIESYITSLRQKAEQTRAGQEGLLNQRAELEALIDRLSGEYDVEVGNRKESIGKRLETAISQLQTVNNKIKPGLTPRDWLVITAMTKINQAMRKADFMGGVTERVTERGELSTGMYKETLNEIYRLAKNAQTTAAFTRNAAWQFTERPGPTAEAGGREARKGTEDWRRKTLITMRERVPPTVVRPEQLPPGTTPVEKKPAPSPEVGKLGGTQKDVRERPRTERDLRMAERRARYDILREQQIIRPRRRTAEIASFPATGQDVVPQETVRYEVPEYKKREIEQRINEIADIIEKREQRKQQAAPEQAAPQTQAEMQMGGTAAEAGPINLPREIPGQKSSQGELPLGALRRDKPRTLGELTRNILTDFGSIYDTWMVDRIEQYGNRQTAPLTAVFRHIIDREKELYGQLTPLLDRARRLAGGISPGRARDLAGWLRELPSRARPTANALRAALWLGKLRTVSPGAAVSNLVDAIENRIIPPAYATEVVEAAKAANREIGMLLQAVVEGFIAGGYFQRNFTSLGYDIIRQGSGDLWDAWTLGIAKANRDPRWTDDEFNTFLEHGVRTDFRNLKKALDDPRTSGFAMEKINQDMARKYRKTVTHVRHLGTWQPVIHSDLFSYLENASRRATHVRAFREVFPMDDDGRKLFAQTMENARANLTDEVQRDMDALVRAMQGHPTDDYSGGWQDYIRAGPQQVGGFTMRMLNQTLNNVFAKLVLTSQMVVQPGEVLTGSAPVFLGYGAYLRGAARLRTLYDVLELMGAVNRVMADYTFNPNSPVRSTFRAIGNVVSKLSAQNFLNEVQEGLAAAAARVTVEDITSGNMSDWQRRMLPQTFKIMGFTNPEIAAMMNGDQRLLGQFQRKAAGFLTGGNKALAEGSRLGANRMFNSVFRFQTYPMIKFNQARRVTTDMLDAWRLGRDRRAATELFARFLFGNAAQGALTAGITSLMFGGATALKIKMKEAEEEPVGFFAEAALASMAGPLYIVFRGMKHKGLLGIGESAMRAAFPYSVIREMWDAGAGAGQYRDQEWYQRIGMFLQQKTPGTKLIGTGMALFGLGNPSRDLDTAITAMNRWKRDELGFVETRSYLESDERAKFRMHMRNVVDAMKDGDDETVMSELLNATMEKDPQAVSQSLLRRKLLVGPDRRPLTDELKEKLAARIGQDAYELIEYHDLMLDRAADGFFIPPPGR